VELNSTGVAISPSTNYTLGGILNDPLNIAVDLSGNLWITNYGGDQIVEMVGGGAPVVTPLSVASTSGKLGSKP
jgi:DNA-binding beta-propeller fold protein YncE